MENGKLSCKAMCCLDIFKPHKAQKLKFPCTYQICPSPRGKAPYLANSPISRTRCTLLGEQGARALQVNRQTCWKQTEKQGWYSGYNFDIISSVVVV